MINNKKSFYDFISVPRVVDWRFPDKDGFCNRTLDCKQLCIKEVLNWKGETELIKVFLNPFDCSHHDLQLRRSDPTLNMGYVIQTINAISPEQVKKLIIQHINYHGYCLLFYKSYNTEYSGYYQRYDIVHWSLIVDADEKGITIIDEAGDPKYFEGQRGRIPWTDFLNNWKKDQYHGLGEIHLSQNENLEWEDDFFNIVKESVTNMINLNGLNQLKDYICRIKDTPSSQLVSILETLEFDVHYYRRLRELWLLAVNKKVIPQRFLDPSWVEELFYLCKCWSLIMGVLMKWKRQPDKDYKQKLVDFLEQTLENERKFFTALKDVVGA